MTEKEAALLGRMVAGLGRPLATAAKKQTSGRLSKVLAALVKRMSAGRLGKAMHRTSTIAGETGKPIATDRKPLLWAKALARRIETHAGKKVKERTARGVGAGILGAGSYGAYQVGKGPSEKEAQWRTELAFAAKLGALAGRN